jgi:hypothetical protein
MDPLHCCVGPLLSSFQWDISSTKLPASIFPCEAIVDPRLSGERRTMALARAGGGGHRVMLPHGMG